MCRQIASQKYRYLSLKTTTHFSGYLSRKPSFSRRRLSCQLERRGRSCRVLLTADGGARANGSRPAVSTAQLARALTGMDLSGISEEHIQAGLVEAVATAMYWQEPDGKDVLTGHCDNRVD
jgi:hypothetical protein